VPSYFAITYLVGFGAEQDVNCNTPSENGVDDDAILSYAVRVLDTPSTAINSDQELVLSRKPLEQTLVYVVNALVIGKEEINLLSVTRTKTLLAPESDEPGVTPLRTENVTQFPSPHRSRAPVILSRLESAYTLGLAINVVERTCPVVVIISSR
jgi:hypothetical protein